MTPLVALIMLAVLVAVGPSFLGTAVATTLAHRMVTFEGTAGRIALLAAVVAAMAVVWLLSRRGLPTSLTLSLTGAIAGSGLGYGLGVAWLTLTWVLAVGLAAPLMSAVGGVVATRSLLRLPGHWPGWATGRWPQRAGFVVQCLAYSANDAQKMVAMLAVAEDSGAQPVHIVWPAQVAVGACFAAGTVVGVRRLAERVAEGMLRVRPLNTVAVELAAAGVVLASSLAGAPISSTQAATTALVGSALETQRHRLRWQVVVSVATAWALTLPLSAGLGFLLGLGARELR